MLTLRRLTFALKAWVPETRRSFHSASFGVKVCQLAEAHYVRRSGHYAMVMELQISATFLSFGSPA